MEESWRMAEIVPVNQDHSYMLNCVTSLDHWIYSTSNCCVRCLEKIGHQKEGTKEILRTKKEELLEFSI